MESRVISEGVCPHQKRRLPRSRVLMSILTLPKQSSPADNLVAAVTNLLTTLEIRVTRSSVRETLETHPFFPSIASARDALTGWGIRSEGLRVDPSLLTRVPLPCLAVLNDGSIIAITEAREDRLTLIDAVHGPLTTSLAEFKAQWEGSLLVVEAGAGAGEPDYARKQSRERLLATGRTVAKIASGSSVLGVGVLTSALIAPPWTAFGLWSVRALGLIGSTILVTHYLTDRGSLLDRICPSKKGRECTGVLNSPAAKLLGHVPLADLGLVYFAGGMLALLLGALSGVPGEVSMGLGLLALTTTPIIVFSFYYQARILKQWCRPCVGIQMILLAEVAGTVPRLHALPIVSGFAFSLMAWSFLTIAGLWAFFRTTGTRSTKTEAWEHRYRRLVRDPPVVESLLRRANRLATDPLPGDLVLGRADRPNEILIVTHPECRHCGPAHRSLETLLRNHEHSLHARIRFLCSDEPSPGRDLAQHCVALQLEDRRAEAANLLHAWFREGLRSGWHDRAPLEHPRRSEPNADSLLRATFKWCVTHSISGTPTILLNGRVLPSALEMDDLGPFLDANLPESFRGN